MTMSLRVETPYDTEIISFKGRKSVYTVFAWANPKTIDVEKMRASLIQRTKTYEAEGILHIHSKTEDCGTKCERYVNGVKAPYLE